MRPQTLSTAGGASPCLGMGKLSGPYLSMGEPVSRECLDAWRGEVRKPLKVNRWMLRVEIRNFEDCNLEDKEEESLKKKQLPT